MSNIDDLKAAEKYSDGQQNTSRGPVTPWAAGGFMILLGTVFFLTSSDLLDGVLPSSWHIWLLIPAYWVVIGAWCAFKSDSPDARIKGLTILLFGLLPFAVAAIPALGISYQFIAPLVLIGIGLSMIFRHTRA